MVKINGIRTYIDPIDKERKVEGCWQCKCPSNNIHERPTDPNFLVRCHNCKIHADGAPDARYVDVLVADHTNSASNLDILRGVQ